jgi:lipopolysaccharide export system protein LptA
MKTWWISFGLAALVATSVLAQTDAPDSANNSASGDNKGVVGLDATTITSERLQLDLSKHVGVFIGNVQVHHPKFDMKSKEVMVDFDSQNKPEKFTARGDVVIKQGNRTATAREAVYVVSDKKVVLTGDPTVVENQNRVTGSTIIFYPDSDRMDVQGRTTVYLFNNP